MSEDQRRYEIFFLIFFCLLLLILFLSKFLHNRPKLKSVLSEPALTVIFGIFCSFLVTLFAAIDEEVEGDDSDKAYLAHSMLNFPTRVFFMALLPPILFNSGYQLQRELFYRHFGAITLFACVGTCISGFSVGYLLYLAKPWMGGFDPTLLELLTFGSLLAATDTVSVAAIMKSKKVDPHLYSLVFGESALNDAVAIVLFHTLADFLVYHDEMMKDHDSMVHCILQYFFSFLTQAVCSPLLGIVFAWIMALALRYGDLKDHVMIELSVYLLPIYIPYILAEVLGLSGMISVFFTGIFAKRYMEPNVSLTTSEHAEILFRLAAFLAETSIFLELGLSVFGLSGSFNWGFIGLALVASLFGRALSIYPLAFLHNLSLARLINSTVDSASDASIPSSVGTVTIASEISNSSSIMETPKSRRDKLIPPNFMHMLWFAGLRGAVAYACARGFPDVYGHNQEMVAATMVIVVFTIVVMGGATEPLLEHLEISTNVDEKEYMRYWHSHRRLKGVLHTFEYRFMYRCAVDKEDKTELPREPIQNMDTWQISNTPINSTSFGREVLNPEPLVIDHVAIDGDALNTSTLDDDDDDDISFDYKNVSHPSFQTML